MSDSPHRGFESLSPDQLALVNEACDRFEYACRQGGSPDIERHVSSAPDSVRGVLLHELILIDAAYRRQSGASVHAENYRRYFPDADRLRLVADLLAEDAAPSAREPIAFPPQLARYEVLGEVGRGGMGVVYRARDRKLERIVCLKTLHPEAVRRPERLARLRREALALSSLNHPNICTLFELEERNEVPYLVFEWVEGKTFRDLSYEPRDLRRLRELFAQTARALDAAHAAGVVHRDIKPENVMVRPDGVVKVLDFGLARLVESGRLQSGLIDERTAEGVLLGTARYMSPEQALGRQATAASDVFSLGIVLYELAAGRHPFAGGHLAAILNAIVEADPVPASAANPALDMRVAALVGRMLDKRPETRPTAAEVAALLDEATDSPGDWPIRLADVASAQVGVVVGREAELRELRQAFAAAQASHGGALFVSGEPGIGKTTLIEGFVNDLASRVDCIVLHGRCSQRLSTSDAYLPILDALARALDGPDGAVVEEAMKSSAPAWRALASSSTDALGRVSAESGQLSAGRLKREFRSLLSVLSQQRVVLLLLDDMHWSDESTVDLLSYLGQDVQRASLLVLGAYRASESSLSNPPFEQFRREFVARGWGRDLALPFLGPEEIVRLLEHLFPDHRFPESFVALLHRRTEGNPLFIQGLVRHLRAEGAIARQDGRWTVAEVASLPDGKLPSSIASLIDAMLHQVSAEDSQLLRVASVQGVEFDAAVVAQVLNADRADVEDGLQRIALEHSLIGPGREREFPDGTLTLRHRFTHVLFQEALYGAITPARRAAWSLEVARVLSRFYARHPDEIALELAFLNEAGRDFSQAIACLQRAARRDVQMGASREAAAACDRGVRLIDRIPPSSERDQVELELQFSCGFAKSLARGYGSQESLAAYQRAEELISRRPAAEELFSVLHGLWAYHLARNDAESLVSLGKRLVRFALDLESPPHAYAAHTSVALTMLRRGELGRAEDCLKAAENSGRYSPEDDRRFIAQMCMPFGPLFHCVRSWLRQLQGREDEALAETTLAVRWGDALGTPQFQVGSWYALLHYLRGDAAQALDCAKQMIEFARRTDLDSYLHSGTVIQAWAAAELAEGKGCRETELLDLAIEVVPAQREQGIRAATPIQMCMIGEALARLGRYTEAQAAFADSLTFGHESGERWWEAETLRQIGLLHERGFGDAVPATERFREALDLAQTQGAGLLKQRCLFDLERLGGGRNGA